MAPINKKPSTGSTPTNTKKLATGSIGKSSTTFGKSSNASSGGKMPSMMGTSGKSNVFMGTSTKKDAPLISSEKSLSMFASSGKSTNHDAARAASMYGSSPKSATAFGSSGKSASPYGSDKTSKLSPINEKSSAPLIAPKISNTLGMSDKNKPTNFGGKNTESKPSHDYPSFVNPKADKSKTSFGIIWIPTRKNKKKDIVYNSHNYERYKEKSPSMYS